MCLSVCLRAYLWNQTRDLYQFFCAWCLWPWLLRQGDEIPKGEGAILGVDRAIQKHWQSCCSVPVAFAAKRITQWPITSCSRRDHSVCQASANRNPEVQAMRPIGREGGDGSAQRGRRLTSTIALLVHGQVTIIFVVSVCLSVCLCVCLCRVFLSRLRSDLDQTRTHVTCPGLVVSPRI